MYIKFDSINTQVSLIDGNNSTLWIHYYPDLYKDLGKHIKWAKYNANGEKIGVDTLIFVNINDSLAFYRSNNYIKCWFDKPQENKFRVTITGFQQRDFLMRWF